MRPTEMNLEKNAPKSLLKTRKTSLKTILSIVFVSSTLQCRTHQIIL